MQGIERIITPDAFATSVFDKMRAIAGDEILPANKSSGVTHITPEDAIKELLEIQHASVAHLPVSSQ